MLDICYGIGVDLDVVFNAKKFAVGKAYMRWQLTVYVLDMTVGYILDHKFEIQYLGMFFTAGQKLECDIDYSVRKFYTQLLIQYIVVVNLLPKSQKYS